MILMSCNHLNHTELFYKMVAVVFPLMGISSKCILNSIGNCFYSVIR